MEETAIQIEPIEGKAAPMTAQEAIFWLQAILDDTLDPHDDTDSKRIEAVEAAIEALKEAVREAVSS